MKLRLSQAARLCNGELFGEDADFDGMQVDSRNIKEGELFCAVVGERVDGHDFVDAAMTLGASGALVEQQLPSSVPKIVAGNVSAAMAAIALHSRRLLRGPVIGVTGSAGKTTVKEMVAAALSPLGDVLKSEGNLNTEYGVPITWSHLSPDHRSAVIEMAMRGLGQIAHLARMSAPDIGVITSIGSAHIGELGSREAIARAKSELLESLPAGGVAVIPSISEYSDMLRNSTLARVTTVGEGGDYEVLEWRQSGGFVEFAIRCPSTEVAGMVAGIGEAQAANAATAIAAAVAAGVAPATAAGALRRAKFPEKRMQVLDRGGVVVWMDAYNSSPESCRLALKSFASLRADGRKIAILGDMLELGDFAEAAHREIGVAAAAAGLDEIALVGPQARWIGSEALAAGFAGEVLYFAEAASARVVIEAAEPGDAVLIKGSRGVALEEVLS